MTFTKYSELYKSFVIMITLSAFLKRTGDTMSSQLKTIHHNF